MKLANSFTIPAEIQDVLNELECSICLPYELTIIEIDRILSAMRTINDKPNITIELSKGSEKRTVDSPSAFDVWEFIFDSVYQLPTAICKLSHGPTKSTVLWDDDDRFVVIGGSTAFCEKAFPHQYDVLEHFYVQSTLNEFENETKLRECFAKLTSKKD